MFQKVLMVCLGNICRSPVAEGLLKTHCEQNQLPTTVNSAGITAMVNHPASENSITVSQKHGVDIQAHRAQQLTQELMIEHDLILVMEEDQKRFLERKYPFAQGKVQCIGRWQKRDITDPYRKPIEAFEHMYDNINNCLNDWIQRYFKG